MTSFNRTASSYSSEGYRRTMDQKIRAPSCHRRYKKRPAVVKLQLTDDPCIEMWADVVECYAKNNYVEAPCSQLYRKWHECFQYAGPKKERLKHKVHNRFHVKYLIDRQKFLLQDPTGTRL